MTTQPYSITNSLEVSHSTGTCFVLSVNTRTETNTTNEAHNVPKTFSSLSC